MPSKAQLTWLEATAQACANAKHIWPDYAACECAIESAWGTSPLATKYHNLFGMKQHQHAEFGTVALPTKERLQGATVSIVAPFINYPSDTASIADHMATLERLRDVYPHYGRALDAKTGEEYVHEACTNYSTAEWREKTVLAIYKEWKGADNESGDLAGTTGKEVSAKVPSVNA